MRHAAINRPIAVITGATSGIGAEFARQLAALKYDLVLTGRRKEKISGLVRELEERHGTQVETIICELANPDHVDRLVKRLQEKSDISLLINNAGFGARGNFAEMELAPHIEMLRVHNEACVRLMHAVIPAMQQRQRGAIINVSSVASRVPRPGSAMYSATKAFLSMLSEALHIELKRDGIVVQALLPGFTRTDFHGRMVGRTGERHDSDPTNEGDDATTPSASPVRSGALANTGPLPYMDVSKVVRASLRALERGKPICVPGAIYRGVLTLVPIVPRKVLYAVMKNASL